MGYKYKAFISYRHLEPDMQTAEKLQKLLEAYKPPKNLGKSKDNWRIFRDVSELQSSSDLSEDIKNAIESSEFLIVICSPKYTESKWCMQELTRFRELHNNTNQNIITILVSGEPHESFPKELTYTEMTTTNEKGEEIKVKVEVEPLAANIKADTLKESMKKLDTEYLRIAAPLLGCDFNDLFQREKRREAARRRKIFGGVSGILSLISVISVTSALTINNKNIKINKQNDQIKAQNEQIAQKNNDLLIENAGHLAVESENLYKKNSLIPAIQKAVSALPSDGEDKPILPEAEYALSRELGMFMHQQLVPQFSLKHECAVEKLSFMGDGKSIVSQDATGIYFWDPENGKLIKKISAADSDFTSSANGSSNTLTAFFDIDRDKTGTFFTSTGTPGSITYEKSSVFNKIYTNYVHDVGDEEPGTGGDVYIYNSENTIWRLDGATGEVKWQAAPSENAYSYCKTIFDDKYVLRMYQDKKTTSSGLEFMGGDVYLELIDRETGKLTDTVKITSISNGTFSILTDIAIQTVKDNVLYVYNSRDCKLSAYDIKDHALSLRTDITVGDNENGVHNVRMQFIGNEPLVCSSTVLAFNNTTSFIRYDKEMKEKKWSVDLPVNFFLQGSVFLIPSDESKYEHDVIAAIAEKSLSLIDYENGSVIKTIPFDSSVVDASYSRRGLIMLTFSDGSEYLISLNSFTSGNTNDNSAFRVQQMNTAVSLCSYSRDRYVTAENYSNTAYIQFVKQNPMFTDIDTGEYMYSRNIIAYDPTGSYAAVTSTFFPNGEYKSGSELVNHFYIYSIGEKKCSEISELEGYKINTAAFIGKDKLIVNACEKQSSGYFSTEDTLFCIDTASGKTEKIDGAPKANRQNVKLIPTSNGAYYLVNANKNMVFVTSGGKYTIWAENTDNSLKPDKEIVNEMFAVSDSRAAILALDSSEEKTQIEVFSFDNQQFIPLDCDLDSDDGLEVQRIFWQNSDTVGVFFNNRTVSLFDAASGKLISTVSLVGTSQEPISVAPVGDDSFAVLCRDSRIYEMNTEGFTGRSCRLDFTSDNENNIREHDSSNAAKLETQHSANGSQIFVIWDDSQAWLLDTSKFTVRYRVDNFAGAPTESSFVFINDIDRNKIGTFPIYTTQQLLNTAKEYLAALGAV